MPGRKNNAVPPVTLEADREAIKALKRLADYVPVKHEQSVEALVALDTEANVAEEDYNALRMECERARERYVNATWALHNRMYDVRASVIAQFGPDAHEVSLVGLKRKSEYKRPTRQKQGA